MRLRLSAIALAILLSGHSMAHASARDLTDKARIKAVAGNWATEFGALRLTEDVAFTKESPEFLLSYFKVEGLPLVYSIVVDDDGQPVLLLLFEGETETRMLGLEIRTPDHLVITAGNNKVVDWYRGPEDGDLTDQTTLRRLSGTWALLQLQDGHNRIEFTIEPDGELPLPNSRYKTRFYKLRSPTGEKLPITYSVVRFPNGDRALVLSTNDDTYLHEEFRLESDAIFLGDKRFANRSTQKITEEVAQKRGSLSVRVAYREILGLTAAEFTVRLSGEESTGFLSLEDSSGSSLLQSGYAYFGSLPKGKYKLTITGYFKRGDEKVPFSMSTNYLFSGGTVVCTANVSSRAFECSEY